MKPKNARYLGMTTLQLSILGGAVALALLIICGLSWFVFMAPPLAAQLPNLPTATEIQSMLSPTTLIAVVTSTPTPSPEIIGTSVPPGDWVEFQTSGAGLWLPNNFVGGDVTNHKQDTINKVIKLGKYFTNIVTAMKNAQPSVALWMIDKTRGQSISITAVTVHHYVGTTDQTLNEFITNDQNGDYNGTPWAMFVTVNETKKMTLLGLETRRQIYQQHGVGRDATGIAYYIKDGADFWIVEYIMDPNQYVNMLPVVEQSISTFNLVK